MPDGEIVRVHVRRIPARAESEDWESVQEDNLDAAGMEKIVRDRVLAGASDQDIAKVAGVTVSQLNELFGEVIGKARAERRIRLHKWQTTAAKKGNVGMLTLLGKHELGQAESQSDDDWPQPQLDPKVG